MNITIKPLVNETKVLLYSGLLAERDRETLFEVNALLPRFEYGREYDQESFLISMQSVSYTHLTLPTNSLV